MGNELDVKDHSNETSMADFIFYAILFSFMLFSAILSGIMLYGSVVGDTSTTLMNLVLVVVFSAATVFVYKTHKKLVKAPDHSQA